MQFLEIRPGEFEMGSLEGDERYRPIRIVRITRPFELGSCPVTQGTWIEVMGGNPSYFPGSDRPVEQVSWNQVQEFIRKLNWRKDGYVYRLPTEAEWEYAAHGDFAGDSLDQMAWYQENSGRQTHPVGQKKPTPRGLFDMLGNVWEWVQDRYHKDYYRTRPNPDTDPCGPDNGSWRVIRGGSWGSLAEHCQAWARTEMSPDEGSFDIGFRVLRQQRGHE